MRLMGIGALFMVLASYVPNTPSKAVVHPDTFPSGADERQEQPKHERTVATFFGKIVKDGDQYVLSDEKRKIWYELDDQQTVGKFDGKTVKVTGTLDAIKNQILVRSIEEASS